MAHRSRAFVLSRTNYFPIRLPLLPPPTFTSSLLFHQTIKSLHWSNYSCSASLSGRNLFRVCNSFSNLAREIMLAASTVADNTIALAVTKHEKFTKLDGIHNHESITLCQIARQMRPIKYQVCRWKSRKLPTTLPASDPKTWTPFCRANKTVN